MADTTILTIQGPQGQQADLRTGGQLVFGSCSCADCHVEILVAAPLGHWLKGVVRVREDHWRLDNLCGDVELVGHDLEDERQAVRIPPGRVGVVVPFELAKVGFGDQPASEMLTVFGPEPRTQQPRPCPVETAVALGVRLDPAAVYMAVLEELCRHDQVSGRLPTSTQIAQALQRRGVTLSCRAVDRHIDYLFRRFFPDVCIADAPRPGWKRRAVAGVGVSALPSGSGSPQT